MDTELQSLEDELDSLINDKIAALEIVDEISDKEMNLRNKISAIRSKKIFPKDEDINVEKVMNLSWRNVDGEFYKRISKWFDKFKYISKEGINYQTDQVGLAIEIDKDKPLEEQHAEIEPFIKHIKPIEIKEYHQETLGAKLAKVIGLNEHTLSQYGFYEIYIFEEDVALVCTSHSILKVIKRFQDFKECLEYVKERHYHKG